MGIDKHIDWDYVWLRHHPTAPGQLEQRAPRLQRMENKTCTRSNAYIYIYGYVYMYVCMYVCMYISHMGCLTILMHIDACRRGGDQDKYVYMYVYMYVYSRFEVPDLLNQWSFPNTK